MVFFFFPVRYLLTNITLWNQRSRQIVRSLKYQAVFTLLLADRDYGVGFDEIIVVKSVVYFNRMVF